jgi:pyrroloquinoline-quinone synthase
MSSICVASGWEALLRPEWLQGLRNTRFLTRCRCRVASCEELHLFVRQQYYYSRHFTRYLHAVMSNLEDEHDRAALTQNLFEEMGVGGGISHAEIYRRMMAVMLPENSEASVFPATQALIDTMLSCCRDPRVMVGLGAICLGAEAIVPEVYSAIMTGFEAIREPQTNLEFFAIHIEGDENHAVTMRNIIVRELERDPRSRLDMDYGAARAIGARVAFFDAIRSDGSNLR